MKSNDQQRWDIFCKIVDNFGDIGVCWRLSHQLANEHGLSVRLFIDQPEIASNIIPTFDQAKSAQTIDGVEIQTWPTNAVTLPDVVVENFSCSLPAVYSQQVADHNKASTQSDAIIWINLEYLSAEKWVEDCHKLPSPHPTLGYTRYFFYPGFNQQTGGLLRESDLMDRRNTFFASESAQQDFWKRHLPAKVDNAFDESIKISLFSYPQANIASLMTALATSEKKVSLIMPYNVQITALNSLINTHQLKLDSTLIINNISLYLIDFLPSIAFDQLLWNCDLNVVRGEDSWIRAIWAGKPFVWQPYIQTEQTHIKKLNAFLADYAPNQDTLSEQIQQANLAWSNAQTVDAQFWPNVLNALPAWQLHSLQYSNALANQADLTTQLVTFANNL